MQTERIVHYHISVDEEEWRVLTLALDFFRQGEAGDVDCEVAERCLRNFELVGPHD